MAKADLRVLTICERRAIYGGILRRASEIAGLNRDQTAVALKVDPGQLGRWWSGNENPQTWRYLESERLATALLVAQAEAHQTGDRVVIETVVRVSRR